MVTIPYLITYAGITVFIVAVIARVVMWMRMPMHVRWELYPVAHEPGDKSEYGGSYLEDSEWWTKPRETSLWGEIKVMVPEILFLVALKEHNRRMWSRSFPLHFGLYLVAGASVLIFLKAVLLSLSPGLIAGVSGLVLQKAILVSGAAGLLLGLVGAVGLLHRRATVAELKDFSTPADIFNLVIFVLAFGFALISLLIWDFGFLDKVSIFVANLVTLKLEPIPGEGLVTVLPLISVAMMSLLLAYIPLTHMSHFIGKYFAYHAIRWNDEPNLPGSGKEKKIKELLSQPVTWAGPHIASDGKKNWVDLAMESEEKEEK